MLFNYRYVEHDIDKFQGYLDALVKEVWCKPTTEFSLDLVRGELREIVLEIYNTEDCMTRGKIGDWLYGPIRDIFELFRSQLTAGQRQQISGWYDHNNDIEALCSADPLKPPATYAEIRDMNPDLEAALRAFCQSLFTDVLGLKAVTKRIGGIDSHYDRFVTENSKGKCPYCGYGDIKCVHRTRREAYDHFLPKGTYPFNSVNFRNLAPMCNECNSSYKLRTDPIRRKGGARRRAFYSYADVDPGIAIAVTLKTTDAANLRPNDLDIQFTAPGREEEVETWNEVFRIEERYKAKLCAENDGKAWVEQIVEESANVPDTTSEQLLARTRRAAERRPYADCNFLKMPFLTACQNAKMFGKR